MVIGDADINAVLFCLREVLKKAVLWPICPKADLREGSDFALRLSFPRCSLSYIKDAPLELGLLALANSYSRPSMFFWRESCSLEKSFLIAVVSIAILEGRKGMARLWKILNFALTEGQDEATPSLLVYLHNSTIPRISTGNTLHKLFHSRSNSDRVVMLEIKQSDSLTLMPFDDFMDLASPLVDFPEVSDLRAALPRMQSDKL